MSLSRVWGLGRGSPLGRQLLVSIMLFSAVVGCIATAVQLLTDYRRDVQALENRLEEIHTSYAPGIEESLWLLDEAQLQVQLEGITTLPGIEFARVDSAIGTQYATGSPPRAERELTRSIPLFRGNLYLGLLQVGASLEDIYLRLQSRVLVILMTQAVKTFLVALFVLFIFHRLVTRHLATMAAYARGLDVEHLDTPLVLGRTPPDDGPRDELDDVSTAFNEMRESLQRELAHRAAIALENERLYQQAERAIRLRDVFVSVAAHELRTPLLPLRLRLQSILRKSTQAPSTLDPAWLVRELTAAEHQTWRLGQLVDQLIDASSLGSGQPLELHRQRVDLCAVVEGILESMKEQIDASGCQVIRKLDTPAVGEWDRRRLEQTVVQLVHNALKFGQRKPVEVSVEPAAESVRLVVRDHGLGMSESEMAGIFDRFSRGVSDRHYGGLGIGLHLVKHHVEAHGGTLSVQSQPGEGSTFTVELPVRGIPGA